MGKVASINPAAIFIGILFWSWVWQVWGLILAVPMLMMMKAVCDRTDAPVIASGGVSSLDDLRAIAALTDRGVEGAIVGKALYAGRFTLPEALAAVRQ